MSQIVRRVARPHLIRAAIATGVALAALVVAKTTGTPRTGGLIDKFELPTTSDYVAAIAAVLFAVAGVVAVRKASRAAGRAMEERLGDARGAPVGLAISIVGYFLLVLTGLDLAGVNLGGLLLGGAITGVVVGIAAQQTLANMFAGIVLLVVRPFVVGDEIVLRSGPLGGEYEGRITDIGLFYVDMSTARGPVKLPNAGVLAGAVGPGARQPAGEPPDDEEEPAAPPSEGGPPGA